MLALNQFVFSFPCSAGAQRKLGGSKARRDHPKWPKRIFHCINDGSWQQPWIYCWGMGWTSGSRCWTIVLCVSCFSWVILLSLLPFDNKSNVNNLFCFSFSTVLIEAPEVCFFPWVLLPSGSGRHVVWTHTQLHWLCCPWLPAGVRPRHTPYYLAFVAFEPMIPVIGSISHLQIENILISVAFCGQVDTWKIFSFFLCFFFLSLQVRKLIWEGTLYLVQEKLRNFLLHTTAKLSCRENNVPHCIVCGLAELWEMAKQFPAVDDSDHQAVLETMEQIGHEPGETKWSSSHIKILCGLWGNSKSPSGEPRSGICQHLSCQCLPVLCPHKAPLCIPVGWGGQGRGVWWEELPGVLGEVW